MVFSFPTSSSLIKSIIIIIIVMKIERPVQERGSNMVIKNPPFSTAVMGDTV